MTYASLRKRLAARLPQGRVARRILTLASGTAMAQVIAICSMPVVTRLYDPAQLGLISLFIAFFGFWSPTLSLRYEYALLIAENDFESHIVHRLGILLVVITSILALPLLWWLRHTNTLGFGLLPDWSPLVAVPIFLGAGTFMVYRSWALRAGAVSLITKATVVRAAASAAMRIILGAFGGGVPALFAAQLTASCAATLKLARSVGRKFAPSKPQSVSVRELLVVGRKYVKFAVLETPSTWMDQLGAALPVTMAASLFGAAAAGWFGLARTIVGIPNAQIGAAVADVFQMEIAGAVIAGDAPRARTLFFKLMRKLAIVGLLPLLAVVTLCPLLTPWLFGHAWEEAGYVAAIIAPWLYAAFVVSPLSRVLSVLQVQEYKLVYDISSVIFLSTAFFVVKSLNLEFMDFVAAVSLAAFSGYVIYGILIVAVVRIRLREVSNNVR